MKINITIFASVLGCAAIVLLIAVTSLAQPNADYDIYLFDVEYGTTQQVTSIAGAGEYNPSFSPDGYSIVHDVKVEAPFSHDLYITDVSTGVSTPLAGADGGNNGVWAPKGGLIAFDRFEVGDPTVYVVPETGGARVAVRSNGIDPDWAPKGDRVVFNDISDGSVRTISITGGSETLVAPFGINPTWSPNGRSIAYSDGTNLFVVRVNKSGAVLGSPVQITFDGAGVYNQQPSWSRNGRVIAFHSNRGGSDFDIWTVPASGGMPMLLTGLGGAGDYDPDVSTKGQLKYVAYAAVGPPPPAAPTTELNGSSGLELSSYPNPFNPSTKLSFTLPDDGYVDARVFDMLGKEIVVLANESMPAGVHSFDWSATDLPSGHYLFRVQTDDERVVELISLVK